MSGKSQNDLAWERLFETHRILDRIESEGVFEISRNTIDQVRDARLMTRFNHRIQLPTIFKQRDLSIQQSSNNTFVIGSFVSYFDLPSADALSVEQIALPPLLETIQPEALYSKSSALLCALNTGMLERLLEEPLAITVVGASPSGNFGYSIQDTQGNTHEVQVNDLQLEIDGGFEGRSVFAIAAAKTETVNDILIKQLYYPYRAWRDRTHKEIVPVLMSYSNDLFSFYLFRFNDHYHYNSIELREQRNFQIGTSEIQIGDITGALNRIKVLDDPIDIPFPQADRFNRVVDLLSQLHHAGTISQEDITINYAFDLRQTHYYTNAARYLGLVQKAHNREEGITYSLSSKGVSIMSQGPATRNLKLAELMLEHRIFNNTARLYLERAQRPDLDQVIDIMRGAQLGLDLEGETTIPRRAQTVLAWVDWMMRLTRN